ncbi:LysM peptidoglycan-binding domain-containing protein [Fundicoccus sp. Sow4_D5]|uniref:LysM peptidoglycan-binding domain-containing protein n=1 Tax=Fundicoccus sp. Sow4_D5 TaxID=3438782 RepID=UPI003F8DC427
MAKDNELNENQEHQDEQQPKQESKFKAPWNKKFGEDENLKTRQYSRAARNQPVKEATTLSKVLLFLLVITLLSPFLLYWFVSAQRSENQIPQRTTSQIQIDQSSIASSESTASSESESESSSESESISSREIDESTAPESSVVESTPPVETTPPVEETPAPETAGSFYVIQAGDSWYGIATAYGVDVYQLAQANGATIDTPIYPGMEIVIP